MKNKILLILKKEIKEIFRDKKSLRMMLMTPFIIPLVIIGLSYLFEYETNEQTKEDVVLGFAYDLTPVEEELLKNYKIDAKTGSEKDLKKMVKNEELFVYITKEDNNYLINYDMNNQNTAAPSAIAKDYLESYKVFLQNSYLVDNNIDSSKVLNIITINYNDTGKKTESFFSNYMTTYAFIFIIMTITISATYPATDTTAGEKERGTMETLLTFPISKHDLIIGKYLGVSISALITGIIGYILTLISFKYAGSAFEIYDGIKLLPNVTTIVLTFLIFIFYSLLISGVCITITSFSKTFKEAQSALGPLSLVTMLPGLISLMVNIKTTPLIAMIPFFNYVQLFSDISSGSINILNIILMFTSTIVLIILVLFIIIKLYRSENILFKS